MENALKVEVTQQLAVTRFKQAVTLTIGFLGLFQARLLDLLLF